MILWLLLVQREIKLLIKIGIGILELFKASAI